MFYRCLFLKYYEDKIEINKKDEIIYELNKSNCIFEKIIEVYFDFICNKKSAFGNLINRKGSNFNRNISICIENN